MCTLNRNSLYSKLPVIFILISFYLLAIATYLIFTNNFPKLKVTDESFVLETTEPSEDGEVAELHQGKETGVMVLLNQLASLAAINNSGMTKFKTQFSTPIKIINKQLIATHVNPPKSSVPNFKKINEFSLVGSDISLEEKQRCRSLFFISEIPKEEFFVKSYHSLH